MLEEVAITANVSYINKSSEEVCLEGFTTKIGETKSHIQISGAFPEIGQDVIVTFIKDEQVILTLVGSVLRLDRNPACPFIVVTHPSYNLFQLIGNVIREIKEEFLSSFKEECWI